MAIEIEQQKKRFIKIPSFASEQEVKDHDLALRVLSSVKPGTKFLVVNYGAVEKLANWPLHRLRYFVRTSAGVAQDVTELLAQAHFLTYRDGFIQTTAAPWLVLNTVARAVHDNFDAWVIAKDAEGAF